MRRFQQTLTQMTGFRSAVSAVCDVCGVLCSTRTITVSHQLYTTDRCLNAMQLSYVNRYSNALYVYTMTHHF